MQAAANDPFDRDLVVVGGGLAGLTAAAVVAQAGRSVVVFEQAGDVGGRAATQVRLGISFNLGPHALYFLGHAFRLLRELGVPFTGRQPDPGESRLLVRDSDAPLPRGLGSLVRSRLFGVREKLRLIRFLTTLARLDRHAFDGVPLSEWVRNLVGVGNAAKFLLALFRVSTYADDAERLSAGVAIGQLKLALKGNVWYIDGGWQTLVDGLRRRASDAGAIVQTGTRVTSVCGSEDGVIIGLADGEIVPVPNGGCRRSTQSGRASSRVSTQNRRWPGGVAAACPSRRRVWMWRLTGSSGPRQRFALGLDRPYYFSVHSAAAKLAPEGISVVHVMKYLARRDRFGRWGHRTGAGKAASIGCGPGGDPISWRGGYLPGMTVSSSLPLASRRRSWRAGRLCTRRGVRTCFWLVTGSGRRGCWLMPRPPAHNPARGRCWRSSREVGPIGGGRRFMSDVDPIFEEYRQRARPAWRIACSVRRATPTT